MNPTRKKDIIDLMKQREGVVKFYKESIKLSSGKYSDFYVDMKEAAGDPVLFYLITILAANKITNNGYDWLIGLELYGGIYAHAIGMKTGIYSATLRKKDKKHGKGKRLEGVKIMNPRKILFIDDVLTSGTSLIKGIDYLIQTGYKIKDVFVLVDRQKGGKETLESKGVNLISLITREELV